MVSKSGVLSSGKLGETPLLGGDDFLSTREFSLSSSKSVDGILNVRFLDSDGEKNRANINTSSLTQSLTESTSHTRLESISTSTRQHLVNSEYVPGVDSAS